MKKGKINEPFELKKLRAEVCLRQHKKPVWILIGAVFFSVGVLKLFYDCNDSKLGHGRR